jgi:hypothetical protein
MDHHCPWISNCVGYYTLKPFLLFTLYLFFLCTHGFILILVKYGYEYAFSLEETLKLIMPYL